MSSDFSNQSDVPNSEDSGAKAGRRILIGSQKDPLAYRPRPPRDWTPVAQPDSDQAQRDQATAEAKAQAEGPTDQSDQQQAAHQGATIQQPLAPQPPAVLEDQSRGQEPQPPETVTQQDVIEDLPMPGIAHRAARDLEDELNEALGDLAIDELLGGVDAISRQPMLELESQHMGRVVAVRRDHVFIELGGREQGIVPLRQMPQPPEPGTVLQVIVQRFDPEEGLYELSVPNAAVAVGEWSDLTEGMLVEARVTGYNSGGLECEVNHIRGFIPISQVSLYRVESLAEFVGEKFTCLVTEANPQRRNLVLSRRAVLEREKEDSRQKLLASLEVGQVRQGVVRKLLDFGAFVDLGGVDGLLHVSQLSWARVKHPSEVLQEGQTITVKIDKIDLAAGKISLGYREMLENPWTQAAAKYPANGTVRGTVTKIMEFGAFVQVEPGVEGLVHISELSPKRVRRVSDVVSPGDEVEAMVLSVDPEAQRMSLSMRLLVQEPEPVQQADHPEGGQTPPVRPARNKPTAPLRGGLGRSAGGEQFGLKW